MGQRLKFSAMLSTIIVFERSLPILERSLTQQPLKGRACWRQRRWDMQLTFSRQSSAQLAYSSVPAVKITSSKCCDISFKNESAPGLIESWPSFWLSYRKKMNHQQINLPLQSAKAFRQDLIPKCTFYLHMDLSMAQE